MICYFPPAYPDELLYSQLSRYYAKSGYLAYIHAAEDLYIPKSLKPNIEFINSLTPTAVTQLTRYMSMEDIIQKHTMFPYYGRFLPYERRQDAFQSLVSMKGGYYNSLPIPKRKCAVDRYLRYCPLCAEQDRKIHGETYWHRIHQMVGMNVCPTHGCYLLDSSIVINSLAARVLITAESAIPIVSNITYSNSELECALSHYMTEVFDADITFDSNITISQFLHDKMKNSPYFTQKQHRYNILWDILSNDFAYFYASLCSDWKINMWQIQNLLMDIRHHFYEICCFAVFLGIHASDLANMNIPAETERYLKKSTPKKRSNRKSPLSFNWEQIDAETLPLVKKAIQELETDGHNRPRKLTVRAIEDLLHLPSNRIRKFCPKCYSEIKKHEETQNEFRARVIVWAAKQVLKSNQVFHLTNINKFAHIKLEDFHVCLPYIKHYADEMLTAQIIDLIMARNNNPAHNGSNVHAATGL